MGAILIALASALLAGQSAEPKRLDAEEMKQAAEGKTKVFLLDVREPKEIEEGGKLKGAVNIPVGELEKRLGEVPKDLPVVTICARGRRAAKAAELLQKNGYKVTGICGMLDYKAKGYEVVFPMDAKKP